MVCLGMGEQAILAKDWLKADETGYTPLHEAAVQGHLDQVPAELLTVENMTMWNWLGVTPIHSAAKYGHLDQVPRDVITVDTMLLERPDNLEARFPVHPSVGSEQFGEKGWEGNRISPILYVVLHEKQMDLLLGLDFPESVSEIMGEEWWERNQVVLRELPGLESAEAGAEIELF
jgi:hypothetical protein